VAYVAVKVPFKNCARRSFQLKSFDIRVIPSQCQNISGKSEKNLDREPAIIASLTLKQSYTFKYHRKAEILAIFVML
jgi:hypothetical protein